MAEFKIPSAEAKYARSFDIANIPHVDIATLDLSVEIGTHYATTKALIAHLAQDTDQNSGDLVRAVAGLHQQLQSLVKMHQDVTNVRRMQAIEAALIDTMREQPAHVKDTFFAAYAEALKPLQSLPTLAPFAAADQ